MIQLRDNAKTPQAKAGDDNASASTLPENTQPKHQPPENSGLAPEAKAGELHLVAVSARSRAETLIAHIAEQSATSVVSPWRDTGALSATNITLATWKYARKTTPVSICRSLARLVRQHDTLVYVLDAARPDLKGGYTALVKEGELAAFARHHACVVVVVLVGMSDDEIALNFCQPTAQATSVQSVVPTFDDEQWHVHYWFRRGQVLTEQAEYLGSATAGQRLPNKAVEPSVKPPTTRRGGTHNGPLFYRADALEGFERLPPKWRVLEAFNSLESHIEPGLSGVLLLGFTGHEQLQELLEQVHHLRAHGGPLWRIMVRERGAVIRLYEEKVLLQAGVTMVIPGQLPLNRVLSLVEALQDWQFKMQLPSLDVLRSRLKLSAYKGYLPAADFFQLVPQLASRNVSYQMDFALVFAHPASGVTQADILSRCRVQREGDLVTTTHDGMYIFLSACRPNDVDKVLFNLFNMPFSHLVAGEERAYSLSSVEFICERGLKSEAALPSTVMPASLFTERDAPTRDAVFYPAPTSPAVVARWPASGAGHNNGEKS